MGIILGIHIIILCIAVSIDSLLTGVSIILTGWVTCDSHGFVCNYYVLLSVLRVFDRCQYHLTGWVTCDSHGFVCNYYVLLSVLRVFDRCQYHL